MSQLNSPNKFNETVQLGPSTDEINKLLSSIPQIPKIPENSQNLSPEKIEEYAQEMYNSIVKQEIVQPATKENLRKKLREKIRDKGLMRKNNNIKEEFLDKKLKESGIEDIEKFKESMKKMDPAQLLKNLKL